ncbi:MAG: YdiU family protein [Sandaracinaceae bacterium]|nr:YdiU family protein [Sandaracinaceae bacterium]
MASLFELPLDNSFVRELPGDPIEENRRRQVRGACWSKVAPTPVAAPALVAHSREVAALLGLAPDALEDPDVVAALAGNRVGDGMAPYAACYGGHQFGNWAGQLGDGRAITLAEAVPRAGERYELQLKGAGPTPYSRTADGRAVLRSSVREFLCSEAMHHLGVPTTRALSLVTTGERVVRDMFYDGHPAPEPGAIVCRVAPTFVRFGNFEIFAARGEHDVLTRLADWTIRTHFPELGEPGPEVYARWLEEIARRTARMVVGWMRVGFVHGVMNTDNMSILGLTIDYGPYGWLEDYDPDWTPNTTDAQGRRYRYGHQPRVAFWNLVRLANALVPLVGEPGPLEAALDAYPDALARGQREMFAQKLGLTEWRPDEDDALAEGLFETLRVVETDMTIFYRKLATLPVALADTTADTTDTTDERLVAPLADAFYAPDAVGAGERARIAGWLRRYLARARQDGLTDAARRARMDAANPKYVLRNYLAQLAIDAAAEGDPSVVRELLDVLRDPYGEQPGKERYAEKRPEWARHRAGCSMLSCSS